LPYGIADVVAPDGIDATDDAAFDDQHRQWPAIGLARYQSIPKKIGKP
jgi:hypothetical protein